MSVETVPTKTKNLKGLMTYLKPEIFESLKQIAEVKDRSVSNLAARILTDWVKNYEATGEKDDD